MKQFIIATIYSLSVLGIGKPNLIGQQSTNNSANFAYNGLSTISSAARVSFSIFPNPAFPGSIAHKKLLYGYDKPDGIVHA